MNQHFLRNIMLVVYFEADTQVILIGSQVGQRRTSCFNSGSNSLQQHDLRSKVTLKHDIFKTYWLSLPKKRLEKTVQKATMAQRRCMEELLAHCQYKEDSKAADLTCKLFVQDWDIFCASRQSLTAGGSGESVNELSDSMDSMADFGPRDQAMSPAPNQTRPPAMLGDDAQPQPPQPLAPVRAGRMLADWLR